MDNFNAWNAEVVRLMAARMECSTEEAASECGDLEEMHEEGLTPEEAVSELCYAIASSM